MKTCECGCGQQTLVYLQTRAKEGHVKGRHRRFVHGHSFKRPTSHGDGFLGFFKSSRGGIIRERTTSIYCVWGGIKTRCFNRHDRAYQWYGARGIGVCAEWKDSFTSFRTWAVSHGFSKGLFIDRIDNDGHYEPSNCRFVTAQESGRNKRDVRLTPMIAAEIRACQGRNRDIARRFGISETHAHNIRVGKAWAAAKDAGIIP